MLTKNPSRSRATFTDQEALLFHSQGRPGKLEVIATKPMATQRDLSLAYSPGVAVPVLAIAEDESRAYDYTTKGNFVAVITNGTAILAAAGLINALHLTGREIATTKLVCNGAGAAGIACLELLRAIGFKPDNLILADTKGVIYEGRKDGMNQWKSAYAVKTQAR